MVLDDLHEKLKFGSSLIYFFFFFFNGSHCISLLPTKFVQAFTVRKYLQRPTLKKILQTLSSLSALTMVH